MSGDVLRSLALLLATVASALLASNGRPFDVAAFDRDRVLRAADGYLSEPPVTITASSSSRSAGGPHDFFSEADYWWPDPANPEGPYVQRDGFSNPETFTDHRRYLMRLSVQVPALVAAWKLTGDLRYAEHAVRHLRAWFVDPRTLMNPHLQYAQAIHGRVTGRGIGIIDTIHLVEVARAIEVLTEAHDHTTALAERDIAAIKQWFAEYLRWMTTHPYGIEEREATNNHGICWVMQVAAFARLTGNEQLIADARNRFKTVLIPQQMARDGSFPRELKRTKPYAYSLFALEALATVAQILDDDLWAFELPDGRGLRRAVEYLAPFIEDKSCWPLPPDVMYAEEWPMRQNSLLFAGIAFGREDYIDLWKRLRADSQVDETIRNYFIRQPILWSRLTQATAVGPPVEITGPNGTVRLRIFADAEGRLRYNVTLDEKPVVETSPLGILLDGADLGDGVAVNKTTQYEIDERYPWRGVHAEAVNRFKGVRVAIRHTDTGTAYTVDARVFDDGAAMRFVVPGKSGQGRAPDAATAFTLPAGSIVWYHDFDRGHYEGMHAFKRIDEVQRNEWAAPPVTVRLPDGAGYAAITEANVRAYAGMGLQADGARGFREVLGHGVPASYPFRLRYEDDVERLAKPATVEGTITTPWRVIVAGRDLHTLVISDIVHNLADPPDPTLFPAGMRTDWIKPGRAVWKYLDGGENTFEEMKEFSRLAGELGFEHHVVEGHWQKWTPEQLRELVEYSRGRGVGIWLWKHSRDLRDPEAVRTFFAMCRKAGVVGAKVDFFDHEAKEVIERYELVLREAARNRVMVNFHGANKPAGEARTWPNEMTREGIYGLEYRRTPEWAPHNTTLPFTRLLAGHADYTPVIFGERRKETSWVHQIATAAVFTSPLLVYGAHPASILANPAADIIKSIPATWDETIVLPASEIGELAIFARRTGTTWFVAVLNGRTARTLRVPLSFLGSREYSATLVRDDPAEPAALRVERAQSAKGTTTLEVELRPAGGFVGRFERR